MKPVKKVRIIVVDDHALFRAGLVSLLTSIPEFEIVGEAGDGEEALAVIAKEKPDVVLLDVNMPVMGGVEMVETLQDLDQPRVLMLTISKHDEDLFGAIAAGADGYLLKDSEPDELRRAINLVAEGKSVLSPEVTSRVLKAVSSSKGLPPDVALSKRELEVLQCLAKGMTSALIAQALYISENTVKTHVRHILEKLEASNRAEAVSRAIQLGIIRQ
ncbi:MAG: response regulator transcription factor [Chloroflexota bacterium]|nr:MAG: response regulator transcription factor [Chloroflexota bacterium]